MNKPTDALERILKIDPPYCDSCHSSAIGKAQRIAKEALDAARDLLPVEAQSEMTKTLLAASPLHELQAERDWRRLSVKLCQAMRIDAGQITMHWAEEFLRKEFDPALAASPQPTINYAALVADINSAVQGDQSTIGSYVRSLIADRTGSQQAVMPLCEHGHTDRMTLCNQCAAREIDGSQQTAQDAPGEAEQGFAFLNPDTGIEWARDHPVESGEVPDAEHVRAMSFGQFDREYPQQTAQEGSDGTANRTRDCQAAPSPRPRHSTPIGRTVMGEPATDAVEQDIVERLRAVHPMTVANSFPFGAVMYKAADEIERLRSRPVAGDDVLREVIAEANNSLFGSQSCFVTTAKGEVVGAVGVTDPPDKYHLAGPIERLKSDSRAAGRAQRALEDGRANEALDILRAALTQGSGT